MHQTHRLSWDGAVDADGHILEPSDLWETYLEPRYRDRALRIVKDDDGLDTLEIDGRHSLMAARGMPSTLAAMGLSTDIAKLHAKGLRPLALGAAAFVFIAAFSLMLVKLTT